MRINHTWFEKLLAMILSPIAEKNPVKLLASDAPVTLSMSRISVGVLIVALVHRLWAPTTPMGWPEATLGIGLVFAPVVLTALGKISPDEVVAFGEHIIDRFGVGDVAKPPYPNMDLAENGP